MPLLRAGDAFPTLELTQVGGERLEIPAAYAGRYGVVLFSRGANCRSCVEQLRAFQRSTSKFADAGITVVVLTADDEAVVEELATKYGLTYPIGHSADVEEIASATDAFVSLDPPQLQTTGFILDPAGEVLISVYSCGALGQLIPDDALELVRDIRKRESVDAEEREKDR
jgi:peroxiredoxin